MGSGEGEGRRSTLLATMMRGLEGPTMAARSGVKEPSKSKRSTTAMIRQRRRARPLSSVRKCSGCRSSCCAAVPTRKASAGSRFW